MKLLILAGGGGTRLWPVSRKNLPKQHLPFIGEQTLLQATYARLSKAFSATDIYVSTNVSQVENIKQQLPKLLVENIIEEPLRKDTAAAIGFAAINLLTKDPQAKFVTINSDAYVKNEAEYLRVLKLVEMLIEKYPKRAILVGIKPTYPETGYGYIKMASQFDKVADGRGGFDEVFEVEKFVEKPNYVTARKYVTQWEYLWNPALFVWDVATLMEKFKEFLPDHYKILMQIKGDVTNKKFVQEKFAEFEAVSIDYGIMEKLTEMLVVPADFGWADIGHWRTIKDVLSSEKENLIKGQVITEDSQGNLIYNYTDKMIATIGLKNMLIVQTSDALLICSKGKAQDVKKIIEKLKASGLEQYL